MKKQPQGEYKKKKGLEVISRIYYSPRIMSSKIALYIPLFVRRIKWLPLSFPFNSRLDY